jgi:outer membrane protein assembly factor BamB/tetratricopeptide (TPR) repeat protein
MPSSSSCLRQKNLGIGTTRRWSDRSLADRSRAALHSSRPTAAENAVRSPPRHWDAWIAPDVRGRIVKPGTSTPGNIAAATLLALCLAGSTAWPGTPGPADPDEFLQADAAKAAGRAEADPPEAPEESPPQTPEGQNVFAPPDREMLRLLSKARQLADQGRHAEAVRCLGAILESPQDYFFRPVAGDPSAQSLKAEAQRLLGRMPDRGRQLYELQYGARARQMLAEAVAAGDADRLADVSRRFFHTRAGYEATLLVGLHHLDHGRPLAGALALERLQQTSPMAGQFEPTLSLAIAAGWLRAGMPDRARQILLALKERNPAATLQIAGKEVGLFAEGGDALAWLGELLGSPVAADVIEAGQWTMFRGGPDRNASAAGGAPLLSMRWRAPTSDDPFVEALLEQICETDRQWDRSPLPALHPLVVNDMVLMRTPRTLLAVDFRTGKRVWEAPVDDPLEVLVDLAQTAPQRRTLQLEYALRLRMWADATYGKLSSDGRRVFAIEDLGLETGRTNLAAVLVGGQRQDAPAGPKPYNRLAAYDVRTGKLRWHVGGSPEEFGLPQAGAFFLGPPLCLMDRLYVLAETAGEIRLMVLSSDTGDLIWLQQLAGTDQALLKDPLRRMAGVSPSYAEGVLVCPTANGSIVAVELTTRSLLWGYSYPQTDRKSAQQVMFFGARSNMDPDPIGRWIDSTAILADGRVLATPVDSDHLHCLDLMDGGLLWREPRDDDLYLACVHDGKAVLVGRRRVRALGLDKTADQTSPAASDQTPEAQRDPGQADRRPAPAWNGRAVEFPPGSTPTGIGFASGECYYVPLSNGEVMGIDLVAGRAVRVSRSRGENVPGNLVCYGGRVISQSALGVEAFHQTKALQEETDRRLAASSDDAEALALRGEILWDEGKLQQAIDCFRRSFQLRPAPNTRRLLREALLDGLGTQFAVERYDSDEIQRLIETPGQRATYLRLMATGLAEAGQLDPALEHYWKLIELDRDHRDLELVEKSHWVRRDRWIQGQLAALRGAASSEVRAKIDQMAEVRFKAAVEEGGPEAVQRFLEYFGSHPIADRAREELVRKYQESGRLLPAELLFGRQERSEDLGRKGAAVAGLAEMLRQSGRWQDAAVPYARLQQELADVACAEGKTGRALVESLPAEDPVREELRSDSLWPPGKVEVTASTRDGPSPSIYNEAPVLFAGDQAPFFSDVTVELHRNPIQLVGRDGLGDPKWQLPMTDLSREAAFLFGRGLTRASACGHLLLLTNGQHVLAVDTLGGLDDDSPQILWRRDLDQPLTTPPGRRWPQAQLAALTWQTLPAPWAGQPYEAVVAPCVVTEEVVCFSRLRNCLALDPLTGQILWVRQNIPLAADVFGDHQYVFIVPPDQTTATVLRTLDGHVLGQREVPIERQGTRGRHVLVWRHSAGRQVLELLDPWESRKLWPPHKFAARATLHPVSHQLAAVYQPDGRLVLVGLEDGRAIVDAKLEPDSSLTEILVLASPRQYVVVNYSRTLTPRPNRRTYLIHGVQSERIARARIYAFDRQGNRLWPSPVTVEDQWLPLSQPDRLPVLAFACMVQEQGSSGRVQAKTSILCIDKRNGEQVCREELSLPTNSFRLLGDPKKKIVQVELQRNTITLTFTERPLGPGSEEDGAPPHASSPPDERSGT